MGKVLDLTGQRFGHLVAIRFVGMIAKRAVWEVQCDCPAATIFQTRGDGLRNGDTTSCGCGRRGTMDLTGQRYGRLVVTRFVGMIKKQAVWEVRCDCPLKTMFQTRANSLRSKNTTSCGCLRRENGCAKLKHGMSKTPLYKLYHQMIKRCEDPKDIGYKDYGGRGIKVCPEWRHDFARFLRDMGPRPTPKHSLERKNSNGNYEPGNVVWATMKQQQRNKRNNRLLTVGEKTATIAEWSELSGINFTTIRERLRRGWDNLRAVTESPKSSTIRGLASSSLASTRSS